MYEAVQNGGCISWIADDCMPARNRVELGDKRKDAQLAREVEFAIPHEMTQAQGIEIAWDFVAQEFVSRGMVADLNVHWDQGLDGETKPHAHVMLTMREVEGEDFDAKVRDWNATKLVEHWREASVNYVELAFYFHSVAVDRIFDLGWSIGIKMSEIVT